VTIYFQTYAKHFESFFKPEYWVIMKNLQFK